MSRIRVAFWNLQNLFDTSASEIAADLGFTPEKGWTEEVFARKVENLAEVINLMHDGQKPDLLGICEIENKDVVERLLGAIEHDDYEIAHAESPDIRGIDTSLIYSRDVFDLAGEPVGHLVHLRYPTRDIFEVPLRVRENDAELTVFVNHWPSRRRGVYESEPFRLAVANHCGRLVDRVLKLSRAEFLALPNSEASLARLNERWNRNVLLVGDFNDEPFNRSILDFLQVSSGEDHLEEPIKKPTTPPEAEIPSAETYLRKQAYLFNCMWPLLGISDEGTHYYSGSINTMNMLDQFIVSRGLYFGSQGLKIALDSVEILKPQIMTTDKGRPREFWFDGEGIKPSRGYSDHFPIQVIIETL
jgi:hypothetical protein